MYRFLAVVFPISSISLRTEKNTMLCVVCLWMLVMLFATPVFLAHGLIIKVTMVKRSAT